VVGHSPYHPNIGGSNLATATSTWREKVVKKCTVKFVISDTVVENFPSHARVVGLSTAIAADMGRAKMAKTNYES
jgi:hypothetical protein